MPSRTLLMWESPDNWNKLVPNERPIHLFVFSALLSCYQSWTKSLNAAVGGLFIYVFEKICCFVCMFVCLHHSIVTTGLSQLVTMDGLHTVCLLVAGFCRWSVFFSLLPCVCCCAHVKHKNTFPLVPLPLSVVLSLHSDFCFAQSCLRSRPSITLSRRTQLSFLSPFFSKLQDWKWKGKTPLSSYESKIWFCLMN